MRTLNQLFYNPKNFGVALSFLTAIFGVNISHAQESAAATGGDAMGNGGTVAYSIGQVVYTTNTENAGSVAQGVQHAYEIFTVGINETTLQISLSVYPNPISENLNLIVSNLSNEKLSYQLVDIQGKLIGTGEVTAATARIPSRV